MKPYNDNTILTWGSHKNKALGNIPDSWFKWLWENSINTKTPIKDRQLHNYIVANADVLKIKL